MSGDRERIEELRATLREADRAYYRDAQPIMSDREYDALMDELVALEREHPELQDPASPSARVGGEPIEGFETVRHAVPMRSIDNTYFLTEADKAEGDHAKDSVESWAARIRRLSGREDLPALVCDPKVDGVALSLRYEDGVLRRAVTRGDGEKGDDVTHAVRTVRGIPLRLDGDDPPGVLEIRGELFIPRPEFDRINADRSERGLDPFMNPRNACAGTVKQLDPAAVAERRLRFLAHGRGETEPGFAATFSEFLGRVSDLGVPVSEHVTVRESLDGVLESIRAFERTRRELEYDTDGMVIRVDDFDIQAELGETSKAPRWIIAFKFEAERKPTTLLDVEHQVGKTGKITPRAIMEPVLLAGTTVRHASLHNYGLVRTKDIRIGDTVLVEKAGEIIPYVLEPVLDQRPRGARRIEPPESCPECGGPIEVERADDGELGQETARRCVNPECPAQLREKLVWFVGRHQMDIDGLGSQTIDLILASEIPLRTFADLFRLPEHRDELISLEGLGDKKADHIGEGLEAAKSRGMARVLAGLGIRHVGSTTAGLLARAFPDIDALMDAELWELMPRAVNGMSKKRREALTGSAETLAIEYETGLGETTAPVVHEYLRSEAARRTFEELRGVGVDLSSRDYRPPSRGGGPYEGMTFVLTGSLESYDRVSLGELLESLGAKVSGSVSGNTDVVVAGEKPGSKLERARRLGVEIWDEATLLDRLEDAGVGRR